MTLELDDRQRAMLQEMGVPVWLPSTAPVPHAEVAPTAIDDSAALAQASRLAERRDGTGSVAPRSTQPPEKDDGTSPRAEPIGLAKDAGAILGLAAMQGEALGQAASVCQACGLCAGRKRATLYMPGTPVQADWLVLGDPPDEDEDRLGRPFVEQAGVLLDNMLRAVGASRGGQGRQGAYLSNVVKCRPPVGRLPQVSELTQCAQFLQRELELVRPKVILAMGRFAAQLLLSEHPQDAGLPLGKQRGRVYRYCGVPVVVSYHPKVLLRAPADKAKAWADLCLAQDMLDGEGRC